MQGHGSSVRPQRHLQDGLSCIVLIDKMHDDTPAVSAIDLIA